MTGIAFVLGLPYPSTVGGAERYVNELARALSRRAPLQLHYMTRPGRAPAAPAPFELGHRYWAPPGRESDRLALSPSLVRAVSRADIVHVHQYGALTTHAVAAVARLRRRPVFVTDHGSNAVGLGGRLGLHALFNGFLEVSRFATSDRPPERTRVVWGGVDPQRLQPGIKQDPPYALYVGRLLPHKGIDVLIEALPPGRRLIVAGRPDPEHAPRYLDLLRTRASGKDVSFELDLDDARLAEVYAAATVCVLPSLWVDVYGRRNRIPELLGLTLLEAMAAGTAVIGTDVASLPEIIQPGRTGEIVPPSDVPALRGALERMFEDPAAAAAAGARGREHVLARFTWDRVADRCLRAYAELGAGPAEAQRAPAAARPAETAARPQVASRG